MILMLNLAFFCSSFKWISCGIRLLPCAEIPHLSNSTALKQIGRSRIRECCCHFTASLTRAVCNPPFLGGGDSKGRR